MDNLEGKEYVEFTWKLLGHGDILKTMKWKISEYCYNFKTGFQRLGSWLF